MAIATIPVSTGANDADYGYTGATWPPNTAVASSTSRTTILARKSFTTQYLISDGYLAFDTSSIPAGATINSVTLRFYLSARNIANSPTLVGEAFNWDNVAGPGSADYAQDVGSTALSVPVANLTNGARNDVAVSAGALTRAGVTKLRLGLSVAGTPTGNNQCNMMSKDGFDADQASTTPTPNAIAPTLIVDYTVAAAPVSVSLTPLSASGALGSAGVTPGAASRPLAALSTGGALGSAGVSAGPVITPVTPLAATLALRNIAATGSVTQALGALAALAALAAPQQTPGAIVTTVGPLGVAGGLLAPAPAGGATSVPVAALGAAASLRTVSSSPGPVSVLLGALGLSGALRTVPPAALFPSPTLTPGPSLVPYTTAGAAAGQGLPALSASGALGDAGVRAGEISVPLGTLGVSGSVGAPSVAPGVATVVLAELHLTGETFAAAEQAGGTRVALDTLFAFAGASAPAVTPGPVSEGVGALSAAPLLGAVASGGGVIAGLSLLAVSGTAPEPSVFPGAISSGLGALQATVEIAPPGVAVGGTLVPVAALSADLALGAVTESIAPRVALVPLALSGGTPVIAEVGGGTQAGLAALSADLALGSVRGLASSPPTPVDRISRVAVESRVYRIPAGTRLSAIRGEPRRYGVPADTRRAAIAREARTVKV